VRLTGIKKNVSSNLILLGFFPSFISLFIIIMFLYSYEVFNYIIALFVIQLILDRFNYNAKLEKNIYFGL